MLCYVVVVVIRSLSLCTTKTELPVCHHEEVERKMGGKADMRDTPACPDLNYPSVDMVFQEERDQTLESNKERLHFVGEKEPNANKFADPGAAVMLINNSWVPPSITKL